MAGRHSTPRRRTGRVALALAALLAVVAVVVAVAVRDGTVPAAAACAKRRTVTVAVTPEMESLVDLAGQRVAERGCTDYTVTAQPSAVAASTFGVSGDTPDLWLPDSSMWFTRLASSGKATARPLVASIASSPIVVVARRGEGQDVPSWLAALAARDMRLGDALTSAVAALPLVAAQLEAPASATAQQKVTSAFVPLAQRGSKDVPQSDDELLRAVSQFGGTAVVSEQRFVNGTGTRGANITSVAPSTGTLMLDYPLASLSDDASVTRAGSALGRQLAASVGRREAAAVGFRDADSDALSQDRGVGNVRRLPLRGTALVDATVRKWSLLALPSRALAVIDVSGSMQAQEPGGTRIDLTEQATLTGIGAFPDGASMGMWAFSSALGGAGRDYRVLASIERMGKVEGSTTHRALLQEAAQSLPTLVGGGTGLYDSTLAAYRAVTKDYDRGAVNSVIVLSDGRNEDTDSIGLEPLLAVLRSQRDRSRPVVIVTIAIGTDADRGVLRRIAEATGGTGYRAELPQDIPTIFVKALQSRLAS